MKLLPFVVVSPQRRFNQYSPVSNKKSNGPRQKLISIRAFTPTEQTERKLYVVDVLTSEGKVFYQVFPQYVEAFNYASDVLDSARPGVKINVDITEIDR